MANNRNIARVIGLFLPLLIAQYQRRCYVLLMGKRNKYICMYKFQLTISNLKLFISQCFLPIKIQLEKNIQLNVKAS